MSELDECVKTLLRQFNKIEWNEERLCVFIEDQPYSIELLNTFDDKDLFQSMAIMENIMLDNYSNIRAVFERAQ